MGPDRLHSKDCQVCSITRQFSSIYLASIIKCWPLKDFSSDRPTRIPKPGWLQYLVHCLILVPQSSDGFYIVQKKLQECNMAVIAFRSWSRGTSYCRKLSPLAVQKAQTACIRLHSHLCTARMCALELIKILKCMHWG